MLFGLQLKTNKMKTKFKLDSYNLAWTLFRKVSPFSFTVTRILYFFSFPFLLLVGVIFAKGWVEISAAFLLGIVFYRTFWNIVSYLVRHESSRVGIKSRTRTEIEPWAAKYLEVDCSEPLYKEIIKLILRK